LLQTLTSLKLLGYGINSTFGHYVNYHVCMYVCSISTQDRSTQSARCLNFFDERHNFSVKRWSGWKNRFQLTWPSGNCGYVFHTKLFLKATIRYPFGIRSHDP
jgi:hypothetical protein